MLSARGRIVGWMLLIVTIALAGSVLATMQVLSVQADELADDELTRAARNFRTFATSPSGRTHHTANALLTRFLRDTVPNRAETAFSIVDGEPQRRTADTPPARLDTDPDFVQKVARVRTPTSASIETSAGTVRYAAIPVTVAGDPHHGVLVIAVFRDQLAATLYRSVQTFGIVAAVALVLAGLASWLVAGKVLEPVRLVRQTAEQITESDLRRRIPVQGRDDVARLATTFNRMLDRLESAFALQREFVDDAGHELRTPITVIRGHLELMSEEPEERARTIALVMDELRRMSRIVDDLLVLAKSGQPNFLELVETNVTDLTVDVLANARTLADRRWVLDEVAEGTVHADEQRLTQAMMQLVSNAVQHTDEGARIGVGSRLAPGRLRLWVSDTGTGVRPQDSERIFERFERGTGERRSDGAGLGLPIVASIAEAHGGTARVEPTTGGGSTFVLDLPAPHAQAFEPELEVAP